MPETLQHNQNANRGYLFAFLSAIILSTTGIFIRYLTVNYQLPALILAFWREIFLSTTLALALLIFSPKLLRLPRQFILYMIAYGFVLAVFNANWTLAVSYNGAAVATVMSYSSAAFTALLGWWLLKEKLGLGKLTAVLLSLGGCFLISGAIYATTWKANFAGIFTGIMAGLCYAIYTLMGRSAAQRGLNSWTMQLYTFAIAAVFMFTANITLGGILPGTTAEPAKLFWPQLTGLGWLLLLILAIGPTLLGYATYNISLIHLDSSVANLIVTLEPVFTAVIAYFVLGEILTFIQLLGGLLVVGGVVVIRLSEGIRKSKE